MTLRIAVMAISALLLIVLSPTARQSLPRRLRSVDRTIFRGIVRAMCADCCVVVADDGQIISVDVNGDTQIAGEPMTGDSVDIMAEIAGQTHIAISIVKTSPA